MSARIEHLRSQAKAAVQAVSAARRASMIRCVYEIPAPLLEKVIEWQISQNIESEAEAVRQLLSRGLPQDDRR